MALEKYFSRLHTALMRKLEKSIPKTRYSSKILVFDDNPTLISTLKTLASIFTWKQDAKSLVIISEQKLPDEIAFTLVQALFQTLSDSKQ